MDKLFKIMLKVAMMMRLIHQLLMLQLLNVIICFFFALEALFIRFIFKRNVVPSFLISLLFRDVILILTAFSSFPLFLL